jgi:hypothetical protein
MKMFVFSLVWFVKGIVLDVALFLIALTVNPLDGDTENALS